jgi:hypothetical protein
MPLHIANGFVRKNLPAIEIIGVLMRIFSFGLVSVMGPSSPFMFVSVFDTVDALMLT